MSMHIVVPVDGSELAEHARCWASAFAQRTGSAISICSVFDPMLACVAAAGGAMIDPEPMLEALEADAGRFGTAAGAQTIAEGVLCTSTVLEGDPAGAIVDFALARHADIIALGTHARHGVALGMLGSVTADVIRTSRVGVLTVRAQTSLAGRGPIVVAVDDSQASAAAAALAVKTARALDAPLHLVHVGLLSDAEPAAFERIAHDAAAANVVCSSEIRHGVVIDAILGAANEHGAALIATGTHGRAAIERLFVGSVASGLVGAATMPVLVVRPPRAA